MGSSNKEGVRVASNKRGHGKGHDKGDSQSNSDGKEVDFDTEIEGDGGGGGLKPDMELEQYLTSALASDSPGAVGVGGSESCAGSDSGGSGSEVDLSTFAQLGLNVDDDSESADDSDRA